MTSIPTSIRAKLGFYAQSYQFAVKVKRFLNFALLITLTVSKNYRNGVHSFAVLTKFSKVHNSSSRCVGNFYRHFTLQSATSVPSDADASSSAKSPTDSVLNLSHYSCNRDFNLVLEDIAIEISNRNIGSKIDVISRATIAEALVKKLELAVQSGDSSFEPDIVTYNTLMKVWAKASQTLAEGRGRGDINEVMHAMDDVPDELNHGGVYSAKDAAERAYNILMTLENNALHGESEIIPNAFSYNTVMDGINKSNSKDAPEMVQSVYNRMVSFSKNGASSKYADLKDSSSSHAVHLPQVHPDTITYSIMIEVLGHSDDPDAMKQVDKLLAVASKKYEENKINEFKPVIRMANSAITAYLKHSASDREDRKNTISAWQVAKKVNDILNIWETKYIETGDIDYQPDITTVTQIIEAYSRCGDIAATEKGDSLFEKAYLDWKENGNERMKPSSTTFTVIINAWAKTKDFRSPSRAEELIKRMEEMYSEDCKSGRGQTSSVKPSIRTYTAAITAWARSSDRTKPQRALKILKKVNDMYKQTGDESIKPNLYTYNAVIDACARCYGNPEQQAASLKIAFAVNKAIFTANLEPNSITYATLLKTASNLLPEGDVRSQVVRAVFEKAKSAGYVDSNVLKAFDQASDRALYHELLKDAEDKNGFINMKNIPLDWRKKTTLKT